MPEGAGQPTGANLQHVIHLSLIVSKDDNFDATTDEDASGDDDDFFKVRGTSSESTTSNQTAVNGRMINHTPPVHSLSQDYSF